MASPEVLGIVGSLREDSYTRIALTRALDGAELAGGEAKLLDLRDYDLPIFNGDAPEAGDAAVMAEQVRSADALLLGTPMYHGSYSSALKTALDYCGFDEFEDTTVGLLAVAGGGFPVTALNHLRSVCRALNAWVIPHQVAIPNVQSVITNGKFTDSDIEDRTIVLGRRAVQYADIEPNPDSFEGIQNVGGDD